MGRAGFACVQNAGCSGMGAAVSMGWLTRRGRSHHPRHVSWSKHPPCGAASRADVRRRSLPSMVSGPDRRPRVRRRGPRRIGVRRGARCGAPFGVRTGGSKTRRASYSRPCAGPGTASYSARHRARLGARQTRPMSCRAPRAGQLPARFDANARSGTCSGMANLMAHDRAQGGDEAGPPCHRSAAG